MYWEASLLSGAAFPGRAVVAKLASLTPGGYRVAGSGTGGLTHPRDGECLAGRGEPGEASGGTGDGDTHTNTERRGVAAD